MEPKEHKYKIYFSEKMYKILGINQGFIYEIDTTPQKAVKKALEKLGYKVYMTRHHSYDSKYEPADIMVECVYYSRLVDKNVTNTSYYYVKRMIKLVK